eukprot:8859371-Lingulodinium_polyedra.AAC.1
MSQRRAFGNLRVDCEMRDAAALVCSSERVIEQFSRECCSEVLEELHSDLQRFADINLGLSMRAAPYGAAR